MHKCCLSGLDVVANGVGADEKGRVSSIVWDTSRTDGSTRLGSGFVPPIDHPRVEPTNPRIEVQITRRTTRFNVHAADPRPADNGDLGGNRIARFPVISKAWAKNVCVPTGRSSADICTLHCRSPLSSKVGLSPSGKKVVPRLPRPSVAVCVSPEPDTVGQKNRYRP